MTADSSQIPIATEDSYKAALGMGRFSDEYGDLLHASQRYYGNANQPRFKWTLFNLIRQFGGINDKTQSQSVSDRLLH